MIIYQEENNFWAEFTQVVVKWSRESTKNAEFWPKSQQFFDKQNWQIHLCEAVTKMFAFLMFA